MFTCLMKNANLLALIATKAMQAAKWGYEASKH